MTAENAQGEIMELVEAGAQVIRSGDLRPGDVIVFATPGRVSQRQFDGLLDAFERNFPGYRVILLEDGMTVDCILHLSDRGGIA